MMGPKTTNLQQQLKELEVTAKSITQDLYTFGSVLAMHSLPDPQSLSSISQIQTGSFTDWETTEPNCTIVTLMPIPEMIQ